MRVHETAKEPHPAKPLGGTTRAQLPYVFLNFYMWRNFAFRGRFHHLNDENILLLNLVLKFIENFSFIVSELVQVNPVNSLTEFLNLKLSHLI